MPAVPSAARPPAATADAPCATAPGSPERWALLVPHRGRLVAISSMRLGDPVEAEDCVHEAMLRTMAFPRLDEERVGAFLTSVTVRLCADRHRSLARATRAVTRLWDGGWQEGPEDRICEQMAGSWLFGELDRLPSRERAVMRARADGLSTRDAAQHLGISHKAAESAFTRARAKLLACALAM
jgi:RNA polymerase sigma factor (sigma-70 family)